MRRLTALAVCLALTAAACSSDGGDGAATRPTTTTELAEATTTTPEAPLERYADYETVSYDDPSHWVCRPDMDDVCEDDLDTTVIAPDGTTSIEAFTAATDPPIDCFYLYPTISRDETAYSDWNTSSDEEGYVTKQQAARLGSQCRVFAPVYRQRTLAGLGSALGGGESEEQGDPFADVLDAFRTYMATDNGGRGVVLIGHSQGAGLLNQLISSEIDPNDDVRAMLVSAYLAGSSVAVPDGELVGGDFANVALCTTDDEVGCVVTWATFRSTATPPANSFFGRPRDAAAGEVAGCVNPADLSGGPDAEAHSYFPTATGGSILSGEPGPSDEPSRWIDAPAGAITTPFVSTPGLVTTQCSRSDGFVYLEATIHPDDGGPRADDVGGDLTPEWGLHLIDVNLVMGDIVTLVAKQAEAYGA